MDTEKCDLKLELEGETLLQAEGIMAQGYGLIPKMVMTDPDISITAKAIYAYICSLAGNGTTAYPSVKNITGVLQINKDTYYKHLKVILERKLCFLRSTRTKSCQFGHNVFVIASQSYKIVCPREPEEPPVSTADTLYTSLVSPGIRSAGYGMLPRQAMKDSQLTASAKAMYAYICSFSGAGKVAFPSRQTMLYHLGISQSTCLKLLRQLIDCEYIAIRQLRENGIFTQNRYYLLDKPKKPEQNQQSPPVCKISDTVKSDAVEPEAVKSDTAKSETVKPAAIINSPTINRPNKNNSSSNSPVCHADWRIAIEHSPAPLQMMVAELDRQTIEEYIEEDIGLDILDIWGSEECRMRVQYLVSLVAEAVKKKSIRVSGEDIPANQFVPKLLRLDLDDYKWVLDKVDKAKGVKNLKTYYLACLYNAHEDMMAAIEHEVQENWF